MYHTPLTPAFFVQVMQPYNVLLNIYHTVYVGLVIVFVSPSGRISYIDLSSNSNQE